MKQLTVLFRNKIIFEAKIIKMDTFRVMNINNNFALLAKANHPLIQILRGVGVTMPIFRKKDCFECLSPHKTVA